MQWWRARARSPRIGWLRSSEPKNRPCASRGYRRVRRRRPPASTPEKRVQTSSPSRQHQDLVLQREIPGHVAEVTHIHAGRPLFFLAGLQNIPQDLDEAAAIDGATTWT